MSIAVRLCVALFCLLLPDLSFAACANGECTCGGLARPSPRPALWSAEVLPDKTQAEARLTAPQGGLVLAFRCSREGMAALRVTGDAVPELGEARGAQREILFRTNRSERRHLLFDQGESDDVLSRPISLRDPILTELSESASVWIGSFDTGAKVGLRGSRAAILHVREFCEGKRDDIPARLPERRGGPSEKPRPSGSFGSVFR